MRPKDLLANPKQFGRAAEAIWRQGVDSDLLDSAVFQHRFSYEMRARIKQTYGNLKNYCSATGQSYQRIGQVLRGDVVFSGKDIGAASANLGISMTFAPSNNEPHVLAARTDAQDVMGAFYTPDEVSRYMVEQIATKEEGEFLEPSFGDGSFLRAIKAVTGTASHITACEIDPAACKQALKTGLLSDSQLFPHSFFDLPTQKRYRYVVGNPPYVRLRSLGIKERLGLLKTSEEILGSRVGEECSEWLPFLLKATTHLKKEGSLALVLPFDFTYVKYAQKVWGFLGSNFGSIKVLRSKERIFEDILQDVILLFADDKGDTTDYVSYKCFESRADLVLGHPAIEANVIIKDIANGERSFQKAMVPKDVVEFIESSPYFVRASQEASFHIGYVCGNKAFFHPSQTEVDTYSIPSESLRCSVVSSRQLGGTGLRTSELPKNDMLWLPSSQPSATEQKYIKHGEEMQVDTGYKCRIRNPWWKVPVVKTPDAILSVFGSAPRVIINDANWTFSNSLLGAYLADGVESEPFCLTWYSSLTLLSIEIEVHSLGGGVLVAVPGETGKVFKIASQHYSKDAEASIEAALKASNMAAAYMAGDKQLSSLIGQEMTDRIKAAVELLRSWRIR